MRSLPILIIFLLCLQIITKAQQTTPVPLPSLLDDIQNEDAYNRDPVLNANENPTEKIHDNIFIKVTANKTSCYVGEPILVTYQLYSALRSESKVSKQPTFTGCSVIELTTDEPPFIQKLRDKYYRVFLIRKVELIPLKEGDLKMDTASVDNDVTFISKDNPYQVQTFSGTANSSPLNIEVKALPLKNKPSAFSGIVGKFHISAKVESSHIPQGENNSLKISIAGEGNLPAITSPDFVWPDGLEHFDIIDSQRIDKMAFPMNGERTFEIPFIGTKEGSITIPKIGFSYFDPSSSTYQTVYTEPISVAVTHALPKTEEFKNIVREDESNRKYLWLVPAIALTVGFVWIISSKSQKKAVKPVAAEDKKIEQVETAMPVQTEKTKIDFKEEVTKLESLTEAPVFFTKMKLLLTEALQEKLHTTETEESTLVEMLSEVVDKETVKDAEEIYKVCNLSLYSPIDEENVKNEMFTKLDQVIKSLDV